MLKEHIAETLRADPLHDRRRRIGRRDAAAPDRLGVPRPARRPPAASRASRTSGASCRRRRTATCSTSYFNDGLAAPVGRAAAARGGDSGRTGQVGCAAQFDGPTRRASARSSATTRGCGWTPTTQAGCGLPAEQVYDRADEPRRRALHDPGLHGRRSSAGAPQDGFANRPYDNTGVQYGLRALRVGPHHRRAVRRPQREGRRARHRLGAVQPARSRRRPRRRSTVAYRGGLVTDGRELAKRARSLDVRGQDNYEIHADFHTYAMRARLDRDNGHHDNQVIWTGARAQVGDPYSFDAGVHGSSTTGSSASRPTAATGSLAREGAAQPAARRAVDTCWFEGRRVTDQSTCRAAFPYFGDPRIAAGRPARRRRPEVPAAAARARRLRRRLHRRAVVAAAARRSRAASATTRGPASASSRPSRGCRSPTARAGARSAPHRHHARSPEAPHHETPRHSDRRRRAGGDGRARAVRVGRRALRHRAVVRHRAQPRRPRRPAAGRADARRADLAAGRRRAERRPRPRGHAHRHEQRRRARRPAADLLQRRPGRDAAGQGDGHALADDAWPRRSTRASPAATRRSSATRCATRATTSSSRPR